MTFNNYFFFNFENFSKLFALNCNAAKIAGDLYFLLQYYNNSNKSFRTIFVPLLGLFLLPLYSICYYCYPPPRHRPTPTTRAPNRATHGRHCTQCDFIFYYCAHLIQYFRAEIYLCGSRRLFNFNYFLSSHQL